MRVSLVVFQASFHTLLSGYAKAGLYREAEQVLTHMEMAGMKAELYTYTILIQAYANSKQPGRAMSIYARMKDNNIEPDQAVFQMMLDAFSKAGLVEFAERVVHAMRSHGYEANAYTMVELIHLYCRVRGEARYWVLTPFCFLLLRTNKLVSPHSSISSSQDFISVAVLQNKLAFPASDSCRGRLDVRTSRAESCLLLDMRTYKLAVTAAPSSRAAWTFFRTGWT
jgi:pentatricopeptide repeat protein